MEKSKIIMEPTAETKKIAEDWQKKEQKRKNPADVFKQRGKTKAEEPKETERKKTNQEIADMPEFREWCENQKIEPTKRQAGKHREEFENYLRTKKAA